MIPYSSKYPWSINFVISVMDLLITKNITHENPISVHFPCTWSHIHGNCYHVICVPQKYGSIRSINVYLSKIFYYSDTAFTEYMFIKRLITMTQLFFR